MVEAQNSGELGPGEYQGQMLVHCACGHPWADYFVLPMDLMAYVTHVRQIRCPECGGQEIYCGSPERRPHDDS